jgi:hypothetical protein
MDNSLSGSCGDETLRPVLHTGDGRIIGGSDCRVLAVRLRAAAERREAVG